MADWLKILQDAVNTDPLGFGVRASAIFLVIVAAIVLGRWLQQVASRIPVGIVSAVERGKLASQRVEQTRTALSRSLGYLAFLCVLLAATEAVIAIVNYGNKGPSIFDPRLMFQGLVAIAPRVIGMLMLVPVTLAAGRLLQRGTVAALGRARVDRSLQLLGGRIVYVTILIIGSVGILTIWGVPLAVPVTFLGVVTLALSLALQDVLRNIFAGIYLLIERPFVIGDEIVVTTFSGRVEDIQLRITSLRAADGQQVLVPNAILFTSAVVNTTANERRRTVLTVTLPSAGPDDFAQVEERITTAIAQLNRVRPNPPPQVMLNRAGQGKLDLRVVFWVPAQDPAAAQSAVSEAIGQIYTVVKEADVSVVEPTPAS